MTTKRTTAPEPTTMSSEQIRAKIDEAVSLGNLADLTTLSRMATGDDAAYLFDRTASSVESGRDADVIGRIAAMAIAGQSLVSYVRAEVQAGRVKGKDGEPLTLSSDDPVTMKHITPCLGLADGGTHVIDGKALGRTDVQRYFYASIVSADHVERAVGSGASSISAAISAAYKLHQNDQRTPEQRAKREAEAEARRLTTEREKREAEAEAERVKDVTPEMAPPDVVALVSTVTDSRTLVAIERAVAARLVAVRKAEREAEANAAAEAVKLLAELQSSGRSVDELRALLAGANATS